MKKKFGWGLKRVLGVAFVVADGHHLVNNIGSS